MTKQKKRFKKIEDNMGIVWFNNWHVLIFLIGILFIISSSISLQINLFFEIINFDHTGTKWITGIGIGFIIWWFVLCLLLAEENVIYEEI